MKLQTDWDHCTFIAESEEDKKLLSDLYYKIKRGNEENIRPRFKHIRNKRENEEDKKLEELSIHTYQ